MNNDKANNCELTKDEMCIQEHLNIENSENHRSCPENAVTTTKHCVTSVEIRSYFWSVFFSIRTEYGDLLCKSSVRIQENMDQK